MPTRQPWKLSQPVIERDLSPEILAELDAAVVGLDRFKRVMNRTPEERKKSYEVDNILRDYLNDNYKSDRS